MATVAIRGINHEINEISDFDMMAIANMYDNLSSIDAQINAAKALAEIVPTFVPNLIKHTGERYKLLLTGKEMDVVMTAIREEYFRQQLDIAKLTNDVEREKELLGYLKKTQKTIPNNLIDNEPASIAELRIADLEKQIQGLKENHQK